MKFATFFSHLEQDAQTLAAREGCSPEAAMKAVLREAKALGITGMTMHYPELTPENLELLADAGMTVDLVSYECRLCFGEDGSQTIRAAEVSARAGAKILMLIPGFTHGLLPEDTARENAYPLLRQVVNRCGALGIAPSVENYGGRRTTFSTVAGVKAYLDNVEGLMAVLDTGNCLYHRQDVLEMLAMMRPRLTGIHAKDLAAEPVEGVGAVTTPCGDRLTPQPFGDGMLPRSALLRAIAASGFDGSVTFEHDGYPDSLAFLRRSMACWQQGGSVR